MGKSRHQGGTVELDGTTLEGGGQLIRIALCLAALTRKAIQINDIRGKRSGGGGLKAQHLACVNWLAQASRARLEGAEKGSKTLLFEPNATASDELSPVYKLVTPEEGSKYYECRLDISTAGSTGLALQAVLPYVLFSPPRVAEGQSHCDDHPVHLTLSGGTNVSGSPSYEYISQVLLPMLGQIGFPHIEAALAKRGWNQGGTSIGSFTLKIPSPSALKKNTHASFQLWHNDDTRSEPQEPRSITATFIGPAAVHDHLREVLTSAVLQQFAEAIDLDRLIINCEDSKHEKRLYLILVATIPNQAHTETYKLGRDWLYDRKVRSTERASTEMAERVTNDLVEEWESGALVDEHMRDQLVIFQALAEGRSQVFPGTENEGLREPSLHARTAEWVCKQMLGVKFEADGACEGVGFVAGDGRMRIAAGHNSRAAHLEKDSQSSASQVNEQGDLVEHTARLSLR